MRNKLTVRIHGTRSGKLRARVEPIEGHSFEVTLGGEKWPALDAELRLKIIGRAYQYLGKLRAELEHAHV
jgi:hypothetical protein